MKTKKIFFIVLSLLLFFNFYGSVLAVDDSATANVTCNTGPAGYVPTPCAQEGSLNYCEPSIPSGQVASVKFGCLDDSHFSAEKILNPGGSTLCNTSIFGDPYGGVVKACFYKLISKPVISSFAATPSASCINSGSTGSINFSWSATNNPTSYTLTQTSPTTATLYTGTNTSYTQTGINPGTAYAFSLTATNQAGSASASTSITVQTCTYSINASAGTGCSISPSGTMTKTSGTSQSFTITASSGYAISSVTDNSVNQGAISSYNLNNIQIDHTIIATCSPTLYTLSVTKNPSAGGTVSSSPSGINCGSSCSNYFSYNATVSLSATPNAGYVFSSWSGDCNASGQVTMTTNKSCTANFTARPDLIANTVNPSTAVLNTLQTFSSTIVNQGTASSGAPFPYYMKIMSGPNGTGSLVKDIIGSVSSSLGVGGTTNATISHTFTSTGTYSIIACADQNSLTESSGSQVNESNESNNCSYPWTNLSFSGSVPSQVTNLQVTPSTCGNNWLNLSWNESSGATSYKVYRNGSLVSLSSFSCSAGTCSGSDTTGLTLGSSYSYNVIASNSIGDSPASSNVSATVGGTCTVTFNKNGGDTEANPTSKTVNYGASVGTLPTAPTRTSYNFSSWNTISGGTGSTFLASTPVTSNLTVYAIWSSVPIPSGTLSASPNPCSIALNASSCTTSLTLNVVNPTGGAQTNVTKPTNVEVISNTTIANTFPKTVSGISVNYPSTTFYLNHNANTLAQTTVSANCSSGGWDPSVLACKQYTVTFNKNGGTTEASPITKTANYGGSVGTLPTPPTRTGYTFNGWNDLASGTGASFTASTLVYSAKTVYAQWIVTPVAVPAVPTGLQVVQNSCSTPSLSISWNVSTGATSYKVYRGGSLISLPYTCNSTTCSGVDSGLSFGTTYSYTVKASNSVGDSASTSAVSKKVDSCACPSVTTSAITSTSQTTATGGGNVTSDGGSTVTGRGVVWSVASLPDISLSTKTSDGTGTGSFTSSMTGLSSGTTYYIRAYATNLAGTCYGAEVVYNGNLPDLTASSMTPTTATINVSQNYSASISNIGSVSTGASFSAFMQVATASNGGGTITDKLAKTVSTINPGGIRTFTDSHIFTSAGTYSVRVCADFTAQGTGGVISELNENNNCGAWVDVVVPPLRSDLVVYDVRPTVAFVNSPTQYFATVKNQGQASTLSAYNVSFKFCNQAGGCASPTVLYNNNILATIVNQTRTPTVFHNGFATLGSNHSVQVCADSSNTITESSESNNCSEWINITVTDTSLPDLTMRNIASTGTVIVNQPRSFIYYIFNDGLLATPSSFNFFFQKGTSQTDLNLIEDIIPALTQSNIINEGASVWGSNFSTIFPTTDTYYLRGCVDKSNRNDSGIIQEVNENNNCSPWLAINPIVSGAGACSSPATHYECANGVSQNNNFSNHLWSWDCVGSLGTASCTELENIDAECDLIGSSYCLQGNYNNDISINPVSGNFEWTCGGVNSGSLASCSLPIAPVGVTLTATPNPVVEGKPIKLKWTSTGISCPTSNFSTPPLSSNGEVEVTPTSSTIYTIICEGAPILGVPNQGNASVDVKVVKPVFLEI